MSNVFNSVMMNRPKRNRFDLSYDRKFSFNMGTLTPMHLQEVVPGDKFNQSCTQMIRLAPMVAPMMHRVDVFTHFFFVPNRILWPNWENFITGGDDGLANPAFPQVRFTGHEVALGSIPDYLGVPTGDYTALKLDVSALPFAAYAKIWNEYYRDQNLQAELASATLTDGNNTAALLADGLLGSPFPRAWEHDYFTSALPFAQKGPAATIPLQGTADIAYDEGGFGRTITRKASDDTAFGYTDYPITNEDAQGRLNADNGTDPVAVNIDVSSTHYVDLDSATATSINDLRRAFRLQEWLERNARGGTRYIEQILSHFGVRGKDSRLQRPEYLGGGRSPLTISEVLQTSESLTTPQGNLAGHGINVGTSNNFSRTFDEHGFIIGIISVRPKTSYFQGINRSYFKFDKLDYLWPTFAHIGEQEILKKELFVTGIATADEEVFGYIPRYSEYRHNHSSVHGDFRETLEYWHMSRKFANQPQLNEQFIKCDPTDRIFAVQNLPDDSEDPDNPVRDFDTLYCHIYHKITAIRPLPLYGTPTL